MMIYQGRVKACVLYIKKTADASRESDEAHRLLSLFIGWREILCLIVLPRTGKEFHAMKRTVFTGCATAMITPYTESGIDYETMAALIDRQIQGGVSALVISGTPGEAATLSPEERRSLLRFSIGHTAGRVPVIAGIGGNDTELSLRHARDAEAAGADAVLLSTPYYNKATERGLFQHFTHVADCIGLPVIVYNVPGRTGIACTAELYARLAEHPGICGVKEASGDVSLVSRTIRLCGDALTVWSGNDDQTLPIMALGGHGVISVASNVVPQEMSELCAALLSGDLPGARGLHFRLAPLFDALFCQVNPIPVKTALCLLGLAPLSFRLPLCAMDDPHKARLTDALRELHLI